ncbi:MAG: hypothetical protein EOO48_14705 [Flavobacterium sp.]|nr:MAG: hypothetical protein EOO48_14705 [Flavobacterium sp.]
MKVRAKLVIIGIISVIATMVLFFAQKPGANTGVFNMIMEIAIMIGLMFVFISINFFAISFILKKIGTFFR